MSFGPNAERIPTEQVKENGRIDRLQPSEKDFINRPGYERYHFVNGPDGVKLKRRGAAPDGSYKWKYSFKPNRNGKLTKEAGEVGEMFQQYARAKTAQQLSQPGQVGAWAGRGRRTEAPRDGTPICHTFCATCDLLEVWCECES